MCGSQAEWSKRREATANGVASLLHGDVAIMWAVLGVQPGRMPLRSRQNSAEMHTPMDCQSDFQTSPWRYMQTGTGNEFGKGVRGASRAAWMRTGLT
jgi:hypothetical protein